MELRNFRVNCTQALVVFMILVLPAFVSANTGLGKVLNVNYKNEVVFTDLGADVLKVGDYVLISDGADLNVTLKVVGTSNKFSKLTPDASVDEVDSLEFSQITVGNSVKKALTNVSNVQPAKVARAAVAQSNGPIQDDPISSLVNDIQNIVEPPIQKGGQPYSNNTAQLENETDRLRAENRVLQDKLAGLNQNLSSMSQMEEEIGRLRSENRNLESNLQNLNNKLNETHNEYKESIKQLQQKIDQSASESDRMTLDADRLKKNIQELTQEREQCFSQIESLKSANVQLKQKLKSIVEMIDHKINLIEVTDTDE